MTLIAMTALTSGVRGELYRWVDDEGNVHYTDTLPPAQVTRGHMEISERGVRVRIVPPAKTMEEREKAQQVERERVQEERLVERQAAADRMLMQTFRSEDDLLMARDRALAAIDVVIQATRKNIRRRQAGLAGLRAAAANLERVGKPVPESLAEGIATTQRSIRASYANIAERESQKEEIRASFARDQARLRQLKARTVPTTGRRVPQPAPSDDE